MRKFISQLYTVPYDGTAKVFPGLNAVKGILILLVICTHCLPEGMLLYFNYFFHMPVFMAVSGFFIKQSAFQNGIGAYMKRMFHRLVIPWIIACIIYLPFQLGARSLGQLSLTDVLYPYYHLWYIPAYLLAAFVCWAVTKWKVPAWPVLVITSLMTMGWFLFFRDTKVAVTEQSLYFIGDKRFYAYLFFFFLAFSLRNGLIRVKLSPVLLIAIIAIFSVLVVVVGYKGQPPLPTVLVYMIFNTALVLFLLLYVARQNWMQSKILLLTNKQSLGIYLYHPFLIFSIYQLIGHPDKVDITKLQGVIVWIVVVATILPFIWLVKKWSLSSKILLGNIKSEVAIPRAQELNLKPALPGNF